MSQIHKFALGAISACVVALAPISAQAANIQLGFVLDESGSISAGNWNIIRNGLASAINLIPTSGTDSYYLSVVTFDDNANTRISNVLVTAASRAGLANTVANMVQGGGWTNYEAGFTAMGTALGAPSRFDFSYVNFATDGEPNTCNNTAGGGAALATAQACAVTARDALITAGVDNISVEGIGVTAANATFLQNSICYPGTCDTTSPYNFPAQGFYIGVADAAGYAAAIGNKVRIVTNQTPEPGTIALAGLALAGLGLARRRKAA